MADTTTWMKCNKPCNDGYCMHRRRHKRRASCEGGCENGARCVPVAVAVRAKPPKSKADATTVLTTERGRDYGPPIKHFAACERMCDVLEDRRKDAILSGESGTVIGLDAEASMRHACRWIIDKLVRAMTSPLKADHWDDIAGYARTAKMALGIDAQKAEGVTK